MEVKEEDIGEEEAAANIMEVEEISENVALLQSVSKKRCFRELQP